MVLKQTPGTRIGSATAICPAPPWTTAKPHGHHSEACVAAQHQHILEAMTQVCSNGAKTVNKIQVVDHLTLRGQDGHFMKNYKHNFSFGHSNINCLVQVELLLGQFKSVFRFTFPQAWGYLAFGFWPTIFFPLSI